MTDNDHRHTGLHWVLLMVLVLVVAACGPSTPSDGTDNTSAAGRDVDTTWVDIGSSGLTIGLIPAGYAFAWNEGHETATFHTFVSTDGGKFSVGRQISPPPYPYPGVKVERAGRTFTVIDGETRILEDVGNDIRVETVSDSLDTETLLRIAESVTYDPTRDPQAALDPSTTSTTTAPRSTTLPTAPGAIDPHLVIHPTTGAPGDPLTICGTLQGASEVRVTLSDPQTGDAWPDDINEFVTPSELGNWCWTGTIPTELQSTDPRTSGVRHPIISGTYEIRVESFGNIIAYRSLKVMAPYGSLGPPSQSPADAARDGVIPELAELAVEVRVHVQAQVVTTEGLWVLSGTTGAPDLLIGGCASTAPGCLYGRDYISTGEYGEVLLMDTAGQQILRAYPLPSFPFEGRGSLVFTDDAIYCASQGDGGLPDSMLCRIDRKTGDWIARVFPSDIDSGFNPPSPDRFIPDNWTIDDPVQRAFFLDLIITPDGLVAVGYNEQLRIDPDTLQLLK